ncbi:neutral zinc metallopeptidase [Geminicoccaceae bacterium 1502E]|nr:neutral zinc metallopeptidase [Geminicoccaceae bacterium 1502E]
MLWQRRRRSGNIEDRRGSGRRGLRIGAAGGLGGLGLVAVLVIGMLLGVDPGVLLNGLGGAPERARAPAGPRPAQEERLADFVSVVLADTEDSWTALFERRGRDYEEPTLVLFDGAVRSGCGTAGAETGPFYCPADRRIYLDLSFFAALDRRLGAPGDFAQAYVVAHEVGHHVQNLLGVAGAVQARRQQVAAREGNRLSVLLELQADCFAGLWAHHAQRTRALLEEGDIEEGMNAASAIGDDRLQRRAGGGVDPDSFTHGSSAERVRWFERGWREGTLEACDTFGAAGS